MNNITKYIYLTIIGLICGFSGGLTGGAADALIVPLLGLFHIFGEKESIGTSLMMLLPPIGIFAVFQYAKKGDVDWLGGVYLAILFTVASYFTAKIGVNLPKKRIKQIFSIFLVIVGIISWPYK